VKITKLELNLFGFNLVWGYEAQNRILGLAEDIVTFRVSESFFVYLSRGQDNIIDNVQSGYYSVVVYTCKKCGEPNYITPQAFWNIGDFDAKC
jgi:hypothetical protein